MLLESRLDCFKLNDFNSGMTLDEHLKSLGEEVKEKYVVCMFFFSNIILPPEYDNLITTLCAGIMTGL